MISAASASTSASQAFLTSLTLTILTFSSLLACTRPLAGFAAAVLECAPQACVTAYCPELEKPGCLGEAVGRLLPWFALFATQPTALPPSPATWQALTALPSRP